MEAHCHKDLPSNSIGAIFDFFRFSVGKRAQGFLTQNGWFNAIVAL
jgi:hypothetical protein